MAIEFSLTESSGVVVVFGEVLLLGKDIIDTGVLIKQVDVWVLQSCCRRWGLLHSTIHHHWNRIVDSTKLLDRLDVARQLLRRASNCSGTARLTHTAIGLLNLRFFDKVSTWLRTGKLLRFLRNGNLLRWFWTVFHVWQLDLLCLRWLSYKDLLIWIIIMAIWSHRWVP